MFLSHKKRYQTCLELLEELRKERLELQTQKLSYNGILDPMAEGVVPILVGDEENKNRNLFTGSQKEYIVDVLAGVATDSGDLLGLMTHSDFSSDPDMARLQSIFSNSPRELSQTVPMHSNRKVKGKRLWWWILHGVTIPESERPRNTVSINELEILSSYLMTGGEIVRELSHMRDVFGDRFRMRQVWASWEPLFNDIHEVEIPFIRFRLVVSSGFYVRTFVSDISRHIEIPLCVYRLNRTRVIL